jgi:hypothetical protein
MYRILRVPPPDAVGSENAGQLPLSARLPAQVILHGDGESRGPPQQLVARIRVVRAKEESLACVQVSR